MKYLAGLFLSAGLLFSASTQQLVIDANNFETNDAKGVTTFTGNVKFKMGSDRLTANRLDIYMKKNTKGKNKKPLKYVATGSVNFTIASKGKVYQGRGQKVIYNPVAQEYTVNGNGYIKEKTEKRELFGEKIFINQKTGAAKVSGTKEKPVRFILNVETNNNNNNGDKQ